MHLASIGGTRMPTCVVYAFESFTRVVMVSAKDMRESAMASKAFILAMQGSQVWVES